MAITPTGAIYKALNFDGQSSRTYGVYITGEAVYNAPERAVEMLSIPGRNGAFPVDQGRFENIEVTYPAGIAADTEADFAEAISDFRNFLCSRAGYCRLTDEYNPDEYRLAIYKSGLEVEPAMLRAGQFNIIFECMPQRFLTSGEIPIDVESGDTITNPTMFDAPPLLGVKGSGKIYMDGVVIEVVNAEIGDVLLHSYERFAGGALPFQATVTIPTGMLNAGDNITGAAVSWTNIVTNDVDNHNAVVESTSSDAYASVHFQYLICATDPYTFVKGTADTHTYSVDYKVRVSGATWDNYQTTATMAYDGNETLTITVADTNTGATCSDADLSEIRAHSTKHTMGDPMYIDLDLGEAYKIEGGSFVSVNNAVSMPAVLPKIVPGANILTYDNTITELEITPRWFKV